MSTSSNGHSWIRRSLIFVILMAGLSPFAVGILAISSINEAWEEGLSLEGDWAFSENGETRGTIQLPKDLNQERTKGQVTTYRFERSVDMDRVSRFEKPFLLAGRIGDVDRVSLNGEVIGGTGTFFPNGSWRRSALRGYEVPSRLLDSSDEIKLTMEVQKLGTELSGVYAGPLGIVESSKAKGWTKTLEFIETTLLALLGIGMIFVGFYYSYVFLSGSPNRYYLSFSLTSLFLGGFNLAVSQALYSLVSNPAWILKFNVISALASGWCCVWFFLLRLKIVPRVVLKVFGLFSAIIGLIALVPSSMDGVRDIYVLWMPALLLFFFYAPIRFFLRKRNPDELLYGLGLVVVMISLMNDMGNVFGIFTTFYFLPYGFTFLVIASALQLAKETAYAHAQVEELVADRTRDLAEAIEQLRSMDQMKQRFFANVSHDLKTPIAVALGAIEDARETAGVALAPAKRSLNKLLGMIQTILDTVKAESGSLALQWKMTPVTDTISQWMQPFQSLGRRHGLNVELKTYGYQGLKVPMDPEKFQRVFDNLLSNAIKFTKKGTVRVTLRTDAARMYLDVEDSGIGIPEPERAQVFERFFQSTRTDLKQHGGSGIGLSFVKEMVELHNGEIWVEESEFAGSKFIVALPLSQDVEIMGEYQLVDDDEERGELLKGSLDVTYPPEKPKAPVEGLPKILCAEDNPEVAQVVVAALSSHFNVHFASNGERALERLESEPFDGLVSDIVMPRMRGDELVPKVRSISKLRDLPIVMLSSHGEEKVIVDLLGMGANDYVTKPFRKEILLARVSSQIHAHRTSKWISKNEKVIELGFLAGGMAHQIRNGLNSLQNHLSYQQKVLHRMMDASMGTEHEVDKVVRDKISRTENFIEKALVRIERLTDSVRSYTTGSKKRTEIKLADSVDLALALHEDRLTKNRIAIERNGLEDKTFKGYSAFHEVFVNLIGNGIDACIGKADGKVEISAKELKDGFEIRVKDNGKGIPPDVIPNLCQPFFTTKDPDSGTGLGLYMVRDIVEAQHGGELEIQSEGEGRGATFIVRVPKVAPETVRNSSVLIHNVGVS